MREISDLRIAYCARCKSAVHPNLLWCGLCPSCKTSLHGTLGDPISDAAYRQQHSKSTLPYFNRENAKTSRGMTFMLYREKLNKWVHGFVAQCDLNVGITLKDFQNDDPDHFIYCHNLTHSDYRRDSTLLREGQDSVLAVLNHLYINGHSTSNTLMWHLDLNCNYKDMWNKEFDTTAYCPF